MELPALGRLATFGDIYDAKTSKFISGFNAFGRSLKCSDISSEGNPHSSSKFSYAIRESEKLEDMDIKGELKLCILSGLIELQGSAKFIKNDRSTKKFIQCSYILKTFTRKESINLNSLIDICNLNGIGGTHMVVGIQYGGNGVVTLRYTSNEMKNSSDIQGVLKGRLSHIIKGELDVAGNIRSAERINDSDLQISVIADVNFEDGDQVNTIEGATKFMEKLSGRVTKYNDGKGVKVAYDLVPLEQIFNFLGKEIIEKQIYHGLEKNKILNISRKFTKLEEAKDAAFQHFLELEDGNSYFTEAQNKFIADEKTNIEILLSTVNDEMIKAMKYFHDNDSETANELLRKIDVQINQVKIYAQKLKNETEKLLKKYDFMKAAESNEVKYISKNRALEQLKVYAKKLYICLFFEKGYDENFNLLTKFMEESKCNDSEMIYVLIDGDVYNDFVQKELKSSTIASLFYMYSNGRYHENEKGKERKNILIYDFTVDTLNFSIIQNYDGRIDVQTTAFTINSSNDPQYIYGGGFRQLVLPDLPRQNIADNVISHANLSHSDIDEVLLFGNLNDLIQNSIKNKFRTTEVRTMAESKPVYILNVENFSATNFDSTTDLGVFYDPAIKTVVIKHAY